MAIALSVGVGQGFRPDRFPEVRGGHGYHAYFVSLIQVVKNLQQLAAQRVTGHIAGRAAEEVHHDFEGNDILSLVPLKYEAIRNFVMRFNVAVTNRNNHGDTLLHRAAGKNYTDLPLLKFLIRHGADPFAKNIAGDVPSNHFHLPQIYRKRRHFYFYTEAEVDSVAEESWTERGMAERNQQCFEQEQHP